MRNWVTVLAAIPLLLSGCLCAEDCPKLRTLHLANARVTSASIESGIGLALPQGATSPALSPFCRVRVAAKPTSASLIHIEIWLPQKKNWNGRLLSRGNGGFAGSLDYAQLAAGLRQSFVSVNSDAGTSPATPENGDALIGHREQWKDWGGRAIHVMTVLSKQITTAYYGKKPTYSYFRGCSTGGEQGLAEAQQHPEDYDGILSGAPANDRVRLHVAILWNFEALQGEGHARLTQDDLILVHEAVLRACPGHTATGDGLLNPPGCAFNPQSLLCSKAHPLPCLSQEKIDAVQKIYAGPRDEEGRSIYPGLERGSELGWLAANGAKQGGVPFGSIFKWVWGPSWDWRTFRFQRDTETMEEQLGASVNATNADLREFYQRKHKLLMYHGWNDPLIAPMTSIRYYKRVKSFNERRPHAGTTEGIATADFLRLYMIGGLRHCGGGIDFNEDEVFSALVRWVEQGSAPPLLQISSGEVEPQ